VIIQVINIKLLITYGGLGSIGLLLDYL